MSGDGHEDGFETRAIHAGQEPAPVHETDESTGETPVADEPSEGRPHRHPFYLRGRKFRIRLPKSRTGLFALLLVIGAMMMTFTDFVESVLRQLAPGS